MKAILVLEPLNHMYGVIQAAHNKGFKVLVLHTLPVCAPPPFENAVDGIDKAVEITDWFDFEALQSTINESFAEYQIAGTYSAAEITLYFEAWFREKHNLPGNSLACVEQNLDKYQVRKKLCEAGLSSLQVFDHHAIDKLQQWPFSGGAYFKPVNGSGSARVSRCENLAELQTLTSDWLQKSEISIPVLKDYIEKSNHYFLEQEIVGELMSVESLVVDGELHILGLSSRTVLAGNTSIEMGANFPHTHPLQQKIVEKITAIHRVLAIRHGATHCEVIVTADNEVELVEINLRFGGADLLYITSLAFDCSIADLLVALVCSEPLELNQLRPSSFASMQYVLAPGAHERFDSIEFPAGVVLGKAFKKPGTALGKNRNQIDHVGGFILQAESRESLVKAIRDVRKTIRINGESIAADQNNCVTIY